MPVNVYEQNICGRIPQRQIPQKGGRVGKPVEKKKKHNTTCHHSEKVRFWEDTNILFPFVTGDFLQPVFHLRGHVEVT